MKEESNCETFAESQVLSKNKKGPPRPAGYPVPFITSARDVSNFPGEKMSALLLSIPHTVKLVKWNMHCGAVFTRVPLLVHQMTLILPYNCQND